MHSRGGNVVFTPQEVDDLYHVVLHLDGQEVGVHPKHRGDVVVGPRERFAVVRNLNDRVAKHRKRWRDTSRKEGRERERRLCESVRPRTCRSSDLDPSCCDACMRRDALLSPEYPTRGLPAQRSCRNRNSRLHKTAHHLQNVQTYNIAA